MIDVCDWCEEEREILFRVDVVERGEGFSYNVCGACPAVIGAEFEYVEDADAVDSYVERVEPIES